jgi:hypothetical protein
MVTSTVSTHAYDLLDQSVPSSWADESHLLCIQALPVLTFHNAHFISKPEGQSGIVL